MPASLATPGGSSCPSEGCRIDAARSMRRGMPSMTHRLLAVGRSRRVQRAGTALVAVASLGLAGLVLRSVLRGDVAVPHLDVRWAAVAAVLVLAGQVCKVAGWNRLFTRAE